MQVVIRIDKPVVYVAVTAGVIALGIFAWALMRKPAVAPAEPAAAPSVVFGRITRLDPPIVAVTSFTEADTTWNLLVNGATAILQLVPWKPGEKEAAEAEFKAYMEKKKPVSGDPIPPPPMSMNLTDFDPDGLTVGLAVGALIDPKPVDGGLYFARAIRPLTEREKATGAVSNTFPY